VASFPDKNKVVRSLSKLKYMVVIDPLVTETSTFWQNHGESNDVDPAAIQTEVFRLPSTCFAEEDGSIANSGAGCSGTGKARMRRAKRVTTAKSWPGFTIACAKCTAPKAAKARSRC
jgi:anaerobic selenocysteine-containing dehydrogenase